MPQLGEPRTVISVMNPYTLVNDLDPKVDLYLNLQVVNCIEEMFRKTMKDIATVYGENNIFFIVNGKVKDIINAIDKFKKKVIDMMYAIFGVEERTLYKKLKNELRKCKPDYHSNKQEPRLKKFMTVMSALKDLDYDGFTDATLALAERLADNDVRELYNLLDGVDNFLHRYVRYVNASPDRDCPRNRATSVLCNTFQECLNGDEEKGEV